MGYYRGKSWVITELSLGLLHERIMGYLNQTLFSYIFESF